MSSIIVGNFGAVATPADLPIDGLIPIDWDGPGNPSAPRQMLIGESLYYDKTGDPLDGHLFQYVSTSMEPTGWLDIGLIQGPPGPDGTPGEKWFTAPGVPDATTPVGAVTGDWYIDSTAGDYYEKMQVNDPGAWVLRGNLAGPPGDEVWIGPDAPPTNIPELWYDTDDTRILGPVDLPIGGLTHDALVKTTDLDGDVGWRNIYSVPSGKVIQFPNAEGAKINLYSTSFGLGISASTLNLFSNGNISFRKDSITGERWGYVDTTGIHVVGDHFVADTDGMGLKMQGSAHIYKQTGGGLVLRRAANTTEVIIEDSAGGNRRNIATKPDSEATVAHNATNCNAPRAGQNYILYNDSIVCWYVSITPRVLWENAWQELIPPNGYPDFLRPSRIIERWIAGAHSTGNATCVALGLEIQLAAKCHAGSRVTAPTSKQPASSTSILCTPEITKRN